MTRLSRRGFIARAAAAGALVSTAGCKVTVDMEKSDLPSLGLELSLCGPWLFRTDPAGEGESAGWAAGSVDPAGWSEVSVPHTWQVTEKDAGYMGQAWYRRQFELPELPKDSVIRAEFEAVYHSAEVWLNGEKIGDHLFKGYTAFTLDLTRAVRPGKANTLAVRVDNAFSDRMLPYKGSFDWAADGGITRPVTLIVTGSLFIERVEVDSAPDKDLAGTDLTLRALVHNSRTSSEKVTLRARVREAESGLTVLELPPFETRLEPGAAALVALPAARLENPRLWHFDHPHLYNLELELTSGKQPVHRLIETFGVRRFEVDGPRFLLNGEPVLLMGLERMAGSVPYYGMAEPEKLIASDHADMKELNCVFSRVHWPQDRRVLDWCDRHGILIQTEVPCWGAGTFEKSQGNQPDSQILENGLEQLREMIARDRNHPSVFAWGLCNEIDGQNPPAAEFARRLHAEARKLDPGRLLTYASNSLHENPGQDIAAIMDFIEWNEYYESWMPGDPSVMRLRLEAIHAAFPDKPVVISEYGFCECEKSHVGGDPRRIEILRTHDAVYREFPWLAGAIFFCYNDYRTHIGDKGEESLKQRVHGVVDLYGSRKPSWEALREESSPVESFTLTGHAGSLTAKIGLRTQLPAYSLTGCSLRWVVFGFGGLPMESHTLALPSLAPGQSYSAGLAFAEKAPQRVRAELVRPTGFTILTAEWRP